MTEKTMQEKSIFDKLNAINVNENTSKKNKFIYLSWCYAWGELQKNYPDATYEVIKFKDGAPYLYDEKTGYMVFTKLTVNNITHEMWLPIMDLQNKAKKNADMMDVNKAIMRCLVKNIAMFGLGLYIYAGEDLPETDNEDKPQKSQSQKPVEKKQEQLKPTQNNDRKITIQEHNELQKLIANAGKNVNKIYEHYKVKALSDLTYNQYVHLNLQLKKQFMCSVKQTIDQAHLAKQSIEKAINKMN
jgi:hypothetical protein